MSQNPNDTSNFLRFLQEETVKSYGADVLDYLYSESEGVFNELGFSPDIETWEIERIKGSIKIVWNYHETKFEEKLAYIVGNLHWSYDENVYHEEQIESVEYRNIAKAFKKTGLEVRTLWLPGVAGQYSGCWELQILLAYNAISEKGAYLSVTLER